MTPTFRAFFKITLFYFNFADNNFDLYIRTKEVEVDVDLLDEHDSFYETTKSLLVLFQIMGIMPIQRSRKGKKSISTKRSFSQINFNKSFFLSINSH